jgi:bisanhydrobacterioruberin hydratase
MPVDASLFKSKNNIATAIAVLFHITGLLGMLLGNTSFFAQLTAMNMLLMFVLILYTHGVDHWSFYFFIVFCAVTGYVVEYAGVHTGLLFGDYEYGNTLGIKYKGIPLIIGINWFIMVYCCGVSIYALTALAKKRLLPEQRSAYAKWSIASVIIDGALLATFFDWIMEPVAVYLHFWKWNADGEIPMLNYISWFVVSCCLLIVFTVGRFKKASKFAIHLLLIEFMFFLLLRTFLL